MVHRLAVTLHLMPWSVKILTQKPHFRLGKSQKSPGVRCGEYTGYGMSIIWIPTKNCCPVITMWLGALLWCRIHLVSSYLICGSSVRIAFADANDPLHSQPYRWLFADKHTSSLSSLKLFLHSQKVKFSDYNACLPAILVNFWSGCTSHTHSCFLKSVIPINNWQGLQHFCSTFLYLAHEPDIGSPLTLIHHTRQLRHTFAQAALAQDRQVTMCIHFPHMCTEATGNTSGSSVAMLQRVWIWVCISRNILVDLV
jgi:hypothetical protein